MSIPVILLALSATLSCSNGQAISCKDDLCEDCPSSLATLGPGGTAQCVIYDSSTAFGGYGFKDGVEKIKYLVRGNFPELCGGQPGSIFIRSPASLESIGCGNLRYTTKQAECSVEIPFEDTFMVSFCCGFGDCNSADIPVTPTLLFASSTGAGPQGIFLQWSNGTLIEPLAVGLAPDSAPRQSVHQVCRGYQEGTYEVAREPYFATFETQIVSDSVAANPDGSPITITYDQSVSESTSFDTSIVDPFGILSWLQFRDH